jgi:hypothetical protein
MVSRLEVANKTNDVLPQSAAPKKVPHGPPVWKRPGWLIAWHMVVNQSLALLHRELALHNCDPSDLSRKERSTGSENTSG